MRNRLCANCATRYPATADRCPECGTHVSGGETPKADGTSNLCIAHGCPLPGTTSDSITGGGGWMCGAHRVAPSAEWQTVTGRIRANGWLHALVRRVREVGAVLLSPDEAQKASAALVEHDLGALGWDPHQESVAQWAGRLERGYWNLVITGQCRSQPTPRPHQYPAGNVAALAPRQAA